MEHAIDEALKRGYITKVAILPVEKTDAVYINNLKVEIKYGGKDYVMHCKKASNRGIPVCTVKVGGTEVDEIEMPEELFVKVKNLIKVGLGGVRVREHGDWLVIEPMKRDVEFPSYLSS